MSKFVIECPNCGRYAEAKTGFFARKKIDCACGYTIDVRTDKLASRECAHCGNTVVYDQSKGEGAKCPVCNEPINTTAEQNKLVEFTCAQCNTRLFANKGAESFTCPVCDHVNDVQKQMMVENIRKEGLASIIKYEGADDSIVWKHPMEDFNMGSQLIVHESQEAIFFRDGQALDLFGPGRYTLETAQLPLLEKAYSLPTNTEGTFHSEVYFINKTVLMSIKWGTPEKVRFIDPLTGVPLEIGACGEMNIQVDNSRRLITKLVGTMKGIAWDDGEGYAKSLQNSFRPLISNAVKTNLSAVIKNEAIDLLEIDEHLDKISQNLGEKIKAGFEEYGLTIPQFYVTNVLLPENDPNFKRIKELHLITLQTRMAQAEATVKTAQAQSEAQYKVAQEQSKAAIEAAHREAELQRQTTETEVKRSEMQRQILEAEANAQAMRLQGMTEAEIMRAKGLTEAEIMQAKGYSQKDVLQADVQKAYAAGLGEMGANGGGASGGIMGDMLGLGVGLAAVGAVAPQLNNMVQGMNPQYGNMQPMQPQNQFAQPMQDTWNCSCGNTKVIGNFCNMCGSKRPALAQPQTWNCECGQTGIVGNFCNNCGKKKE